MDVKEDGRPRQWPPMWQAGAAKNARDQLQLEFPRGSDISRGLYGADYKEATPRQKNMRKALRFSGPGSYKAKFRKVRKYIPRGLGALGGFLSSRNLAGARTGWKAGAGFSKAIGWGDYHTNQIIRGSPQGDPQKVIHHFNSITENLSGDIVYSNCEFVTNIKATIPSGASASQFENRTFQINPGIAGSFPFLSQIANNFELYEFEGLMFQYKPTSGEFGSSNSNALGKVIMATNYDPDAVEFGNAIQMENYDYAVSCKPSSGAVHGVECAPNQRTTKLMYTRSGTSVKDKVFTDIGTFQLATEGIPAGVAGEVLVGELWVTYTVKLSRARLYDSIGNSCNYSTITWTPFTTVFSDAANNAVIDQTLGLELLQDGGADSNSVRLRFPPSISFGKYLVMVYFRINGTSGAAPVIDLPASCTIDNLTPEAVRVTDTAAFGEKVKLKYVTVNALASQQAAFDVGVQSPPSASYQRIQILVVQVDPDLA